MKKISNHSAVASLAVSLLVLLLACDVVAQSKKVLNQKLAVELAENFVSQHGYTDKPASGDTRRLYLERGERIADIQNILAARSDSIMSRAVIALIKEVDGQSVWSVQFLFVKQKIDREYDFGREVRMSLDGSRIWMEREVIPVWKARIMGDCLGGEEEKEKPKETP